MEGLDPSPGPGSSWRTEWEQRAVRSPQARSPSLHRSQFEEGEVVRTAQRSRGAPVGEPRSYSTAPRGYASEPRSYTTEPRTRVGEPRSSVARTSTARRSPTGATMTGYRRTSAESENVEMVEAPEPLRDGHGLKPMPAGETGVAAGMVHDHGGAYEYGDEYGHGGCENCGEYGDEGFESCGLGGCGLGFHGALWRSVQLSAGAHAFKTPVDLARNGNFGLHEIVNFGGPLSGGLHIGYQIGAGFHQSNFSGTQFQAGHGGRNQTFLTAGLFKRAMCSGWQWGVVYDYQRDIYYDSAEFQQIRSETSLVMPNGNEIGYFGAYGLNSDSYVSQALQFDANDMFCLFYRRQFEFGGEGRVWGGVTGWGDGIFGAEARMPLGKSFAMENRFNYLMPKDGRGTAGKTQEAWGLMFSLVWYPGRHVSCETHNPYRPLLPVADNSTFVITSPAFYR
jgi:hypothetical protein